MVEIKIWGDYACFSRPEFKVERVSYPVITPSAARGVLEAIFWKPEFRYEIREIWVLNPIREATILRNELGHRQGRHPIFVEDQRQQRTSMILKDVAYLIRTEMVLRPHATDAIYKYSDQLRRRIERGQCYRTPYLGTREFAAHFAASEGDETPQDLDLELGTMLFDVAFIPDETRAELEFMRHGEDGADITSGYHHALFFDAKVEKGILSIPDEKYQELYRLEGYHV